MSQFVPAEPIHPGEYIQDELDAREWTQDDLAAIMGMSRRQVINLIKGKSGVSSEAAICLAGAFDQEAETWMHLQVAYELARAAEDHGEIEARCDF